MRIEKYINDKGEFRCFAVNNAHVSRNGLTTMIASLEGVEILRKPKFFDDDVFCEFKINGHKFFVEEPYGDNATYDVVAPAVNMKELEALAKHIESLPPIKGGDMGHNLYFLTTFIIGAAFFFAFLRAIWSLFSG